MTLDLMMPRVDGLTVVKFLMIAYGTIARNEICPPVLRCVEKPFDVDALLTHAEECASR